MTSLSTPVPSGYEAGVCNIGPAEISRRRRTGHAGTIATIGLFIVLVVMGVPPAWRLLLALPAALGAVGYLQARRHFCAGFAIQGVFNLGELGAQTTVADPEATRRDRSAARRLLGEAALIGLLVGVVAALLPV